MNEDSISSVFRSQAKLEELLDLVKDAESILILTHDNPDPDAASSASCLSYIISKKLGVRVRIGYGGIIGRAENRTMLRLLRIHTAKLTEARIRKHKWIILMDTQPLTGNNSLPRRVPVKGVLDHHPERKSTRAPFIDIRPEYGALATMLTEYLFSSGLDIPTNLATALFYGIASETQDLGREVAEADTAAYIALFPKTNKKLLSRIRQPTVPRDHFAYLARAIKNAATYKHSIATYLGRVDNPDIVAQVTEMMLTLRRMTWAMSTGRHKDTILVSLRTTRAKANAGRIAGRVIGRMGTAGGHEMVAGGQITISGMSEKQRDELEEVVIDAFFRVLGKPEGGELTPLVPPEKEKEKEEPETGTNGTTKREEVNR